MRETNKRSPDDSTECNTFREHNITINVTNKNVTMIVYSIKFSLVECNVIKTSRITFYINPIFISRSSEGQCFKISIDNHDYAITIIFMSYRVTWIP